MHKENVCIDRKVAVPDFVRHLLRVIFKKKTKKKQYIQAIETKGSQVILCFQTVQLCNSQLKFSDQARVQSYTFTPSPCDPTMGGRTAMIAGKSGKRE